MPNGPSDYYNLDGEPIGLWEWASLFRVPEYKVVARTDIGVEGETDVWVSTVWLGLDHGFGDGPPLIFETMIFGLPPDHPMADYQERYHTIDQAKEGHERVCLQLQATGLHVDNE